MLITTQPDSENDLNINSIMITRRIFEEVMKLYNIPNSKEGNPQYKLTEIDVVMMHAKLYCAGDKYDIAGLQEIAMIGLSEKLPCEILEAYFHGIIIPYLMVNTPSSDHSLRMFIAEQIYNDMDRFGIRPCVREILDHFPELNDYCIRYEFDDDEDEDEDDDDEDDDDEVQ
jgi:hypothetical protein